MLEDQAVQFQGCDPGVNPSHLASSQSSRTAGFPASWDTYIPHQQRMDPGVLLTRKPREQPQEQPRTQALLCIYICQLRGLPYGGTNWGTEGKPLSTHSWQREGGPSGAFFMSDRDEPRSSFSGTQCARALLLSEGNITVLFSMAASAQISLGLSRAEVLHKQLPREATCSQCWLYLSCCCA